MPNRRNDACVVLLIGVAIIWALASLAGAMHGHDLNSRVGFALLPSVVLGSIISIPTLFVS